jgi:hypothetical protein
MTTEDWQEKVIVKIKYRYGEETPIDNHSGVRVCYRLPITKLEDYEHLPRKVRRDIDRRKTGLINTALYMMGFIPEDTQLPLEMCERLRDSFWEDVRINFENTVAEIVNEAHFEYYDICFVVEQELAEDDESKEFVIYYSLDWAFNLRYYLIWDRAKTLEDLKY